MNNNEKYRLLEAAFRSAYPSRTKQKNQQDCNQVWNAMKTDKDFPTKFCKKLEELKEIERKSKHRITNYFFANPANNDTSLKESYATIKSETKSSESPPSPKPPNEKSNSKPTENVEKSRKQNEIVKKIQIAKTGLFLIRERNGHHSADDNVKMKMLEKEVNDLEKALNILQRNAARQKEFRLKNKRKIDDIIKEHPELAEKLRPNSKKGRPSSNEVHQPKDDYENNK